MTSVLGHLSKLDFTTEYRRWNSQSPIALFDAPLVHCTAQEMEGVRKNLENEARCCDLLVLFTDGDREGENIGSEIADVCRNVNRNLEIKRARFSVVGHREINQACNNLTELDMAQVQAVDARRELDLRIGAAFTRFLTISFRPRFLELDGAILSYGGCQFPTLGFVVERYKEVQRFKPETFWTISITDPATETKFEWVREKTFDNPIAVAVHGKVSDAKEARVVKSEEKPRTKYKPRPLTTVDLQTLGTRLLKMSSDDIMKQAESLYQKGLLSYPRTETNQWDAGTNFQTVLQEFHGHPRFGDYAQGLTNGGFSKPRNGNKNDQAHPPIHPIKVGHNLSEREKRVHDLIVQHFLATCSLDAKGFDTTVEVGCGEEEFRATGTRVSEKNFIEIWPYEKWSEKPIAEYREGQQFSPTSEIWESQTTGPAFLTEADLIQLMDAAGIGTDATIHEHIKKVIERRYVCKEQGYLLPSSLGMALVEGYDSTSEDVAQMWKPELRAHMEHQMKLVSDKQSTKERVVQEGVQKYRSLFSKLSENSQNVVDCLSKYLGHPPDGTDDQSRGGQGRQAWDADRDNGAPVPIQTGASTERHYDSARYGGQRRATYGGREPPAQDEPVRLASSGPRHCHCGVEAKELTVRKEGPNQGRAFLTCSKSRGGCNFFEWVTDTTKTTSRASPAFQGSGSAVSGRALSSTTQSTNTVKGTCYKCGQPGHWANNCPNGDKPKQSRSSYSFKKATSGIICFKCGEPGHLAPQCPNAGRSAQASGRSWTPSGTSQGLGARAGDGG